MPGEVAPPGPWPGARPDVLTIRHAIGKPLNPPTWSAAPETEYIRTQSFPGKLEQVRVARAFAAGFVNGSPVAGDVVLCVSEFSANAVLHSHSRERDGRFAVRIEVHAPHYTWVEVEDGGGPWESEPDESLAGHGLDIVGKIASEWGIDGCLSGWITWARFDWPRP